MNKGGLDADFNYVGASFVPVNGDKANMTLGDITASDDFLFSTIQFWTNGGANKRVTVNEFVNVTANYVYWGDPSWTEANVAGWYLESDTSAKYPQNDVVIPFGTGFVVARYASEPDATVNFAGQVTESTTALGNFAADFNYVASGCPRAITLGELVASDDFLFSTVQFWTNGGANKRVTVNEFENVTANYVYWGDASWTAANVAGWYLESDTSAKYPQNDVEIAAGGAFIVARYASEPDVVITVPGAL